MRGRYMTSHLVDAHRIKHGLYNGSAHDTSFSFSDTYDPVPIFCSPLRVLLSVCVCPSLDPLLLCVAVR